MKISASRIHFHTPCPISKILAVFATVSLTSTYLLADPAEKSATDKSAYDLMHPTPDSLLRDFDTDRPDKTNSPHTLDAGRFQLEAGIIGYTRNKESGVRTQNVSWADTMLRAGLTSSTELQLEIPFFQTQSDKGLTTGKSDRSGGIGDLTAILKTNFWGNDSGDTACGIELFVTAPTASHNFGNKKAEGGALFLLGFKLPQDFDLGINSGVNLVVDDDNDYDSQIVDSISVSHTIVGPLSGYLEFYSAVPTSDAGNWEGSVDVGLLLMLGKNFQLDSGVNFGVTRSADDLMTFFGASYRF